MYCNDCLVPLTVEHLLAECPSLGELRTQHFGAQRVADGTYQLSSILGEESCRVGGDTFLFVKEAGLLQKI